MIWNIVKIYLICGAIVAAVNCIGGIIASFNNTLPQPKTIKSVAINAIGTLGIMLLWPITLVSVLYSFFGKRGVDYTNSLIDLYTMSFDDTKNEDDKNDESH